MASLSEILAPFQGKNLVEWFDDLTILWHETGPIEPDDHLSPKGMTQWIHYSNFVLWHYEDEARRVDVSDSEIAKCKRAIDKRNQQRNDGIEQLDIWIDNALTAAGVQPPRDAEINSETPGSIIDRLSILSLKIFHMEEQARREEAEDSHRTLSELRAKVLAEQRSDLLHALDRLFLDLRMTKKQHKVYRQFKMYNDPRFNPALYKKNANKAS